MDLVTLSTKEIVASSVTHADYNEDLHFVSDGKCYINFKLMVLPFSKAFTVIPQSKLICRLDFKDNLWIDENFIGGPYEDLRACNTGLVVLKDKIAYFIGKEQEIKGTPIGMINGVPFFIYRLPVDNVIKISKGKARALLTSYGTAYIRSNSRILFEKVSEDKFTNITCDSEYFVGTTDDGFLYFKNKTETKAKDAMISEGKITFTNDDLIVVSSLYGLK